MNKDEDIVTEALLRIIKVAQLNPDGEPLEILQFIDQCVFEDEENLHLGYALGRWYELFEEEEDA